MLLELKVTNFAIIDSVQITFENGLNILSGETGAGKSVLLKSLALLMGEKALSDTVRTGSDSAVVEGWFDLSDRNDVASNLNQMGIDATESSLVVRRVISAQGKSRVYLNGSLSALSSLRQIVAPLIEVTGQAAPLIEMTGQHDNRNLQSKAYHLDVLDDYTGAWALRKQVADKAQHLALLNEKIQTIEDEARTRTQRLDFLTFQRDEIKRLELFPGEEDNLESKVSRLKNASRLTEFVESAESALYSDDESALVRIHSIIQKGMELTKLDDQLLSKLDNLTQAKALVEESVYELRDYGKSLEGDPASLNESEDRLSQLRKLQKKYGGSVEEIISTLETIEDEISQLENSDESLKQYLVERDKQKKELLALAEDLHQRRVNGADLLAKGVNEELLDLNMKGVTFAVHVDTLPEVSSSGISDVEFLIRSSKSDQLRPLAKFASGGELSRILLSLKRVAGHSKQPRTYLFDEVDAGVSGLTAEKVGRKLKSIAHGQQVICVTHLPQVASFADAHYLIEKHPNKKGVHMQVTRLGSGDRVKEIARLISGEKITKTSLDHAKQLLTESH